MQRPLIDNLWEAASLTPDFAGNEKEIDEARVLI